MELAETLKAAFFVYTVFPFLLFLMMLVTRQP